ncbi:hypothetical protein EWI61_07430 [Methylolobus aquaticus]|nr:hypothetical protein EWI61_07430 [Methylolobus aquaticus]
MNTVIRSLMASLLAVMLAGCAGDPVKIASVTDVSKIDRTQGRRITAEAGGFQLLLVIPINVNSRQRRAYEELLQEAAGDEIADVKVTEQWAYGFVGTTYWTVMEATAYPRKHEVRPR